MALVKKGLKRKAEISNNVQNVSKEETSAENEDIEKEELWGTICNEDDSSDDNEEDDGDSDEFMSEDEKDNANEVNSDGSDGEESEDEYSEEDGESDLSFETDSDANEEVSHCDSSENLKNNSVNNDDSAVEETEEKSNLGKEKSQGKISKKSKRTRTKQTSQKTEVPENNDNTHRQQDEYHSDTSDEEDIRNTVGNVPMNWYEDYPHLGYDWDGKKIGKPPRGDELDNFLRKMEDPNFWRTVKDPQTGQDVILCDADTELIERLQKQEIPDPEFDDEASWIEWFSSEVMVTPIRKFPVHKRSFLPSKDEARKVGKIVHAIKMGWIKPKQPKPKEPQFYMLWQTDDTAEHMRRIHDHIPAPKRNLPGHVESYNPPPEYLFDKRELKQWKKLKDEPWKRKVHFIPQKYPSLRKVPSYGRYIKERYFRCLDLYMCARARKMKLTIEPEDLIPKLPSPKDLQPFPTVQSLVYEGHTEMVRTITVEPKGQYLASGSDDYTVKIWEIATGRCVRTIQAGGTVRSVSWCPNTALCLLAVAADRKLLLVNAGVGDFLVIKKTDTLLEEPPEQDALIAERVKAAVQWEQATGEDWDKGIRIIINHFKEIKQVTWHGRGDYFATVMPEGLNRSVLIHQLSKRRSQIPFNKAKGLVQCVLFHPIRPIFFVATQKNVRIYDLMKQELVKKLLTNAKWISSIAVHPAGDNLIVGAYDCKTMWFDLDYSVKPYQTLHLHNYAVRGVTYHKRYPLFASSSDDCSVIVSHGMVYNDLLQNPLIVPLKRLDTHEKKNDFGVFDVIFHPTQPWVFSCGADNTVRLYT